MTVAVTLIVLVGAACAVVSIACMFRRRWWPAFLLALPALYVILGGTIAVIKGELIRDARHKAMERGDIPREEAVRK
ncbi:hypothetical protein JCM17478_37270 [Thermopirellula anaerolimosa]